MMHSSYLLLTAHILFTDDHLHLVSIVKLEEKEDQEDCLKLARMLPLHVMHKKCIFSRLLYCKLYQIMKDNKDDYAVKRC